MIKKSITLVTGIMVVCLVLMGVLSCNGQERSEQEIPSDFTTYTDEIGLFSISYPSEWETALSSMGITEEAVKDYISSIDSNVPINEAQYIFAAGLPVTEGYMPNVNIVVEPLPQGAFTHDEYVEANIIGIKDIVSDYRLFSQKKTKINGKTTTILDYEGTYPQLGVFRCKQSILITGNNGWVVSCVPPQGEFSLWEDDFDAILKSLRVND